MRCSHVGLGEHEEVIDTRDPDVRVLVKQSLGLVDPGGVVLLDHSRNFVYDSFSTLVDVQSVPHFGGIENVAAVRRNSTVRTTLNRKWPSTPQPSGARSSLLPTIVLRHR